jgi:hypothetical protein
MQNKHPIDPSQPVPNNRRSGADRRRVESGPPGRHERRRDIESRKPEVVELDMSESEWTALNRDPSAPGS